MTTEEALSVHIAGTDRSSDLGAEVSSVAARRRSSSLEHAIQSEADVIAKETAADEAEYLFEQIALLRTRSNVDPNRLDISSRPGFSGRVMRTLRQFLWKLLRYQHDWMFFHQNTINAEMVHLLDSESKVRSQQCAVLEERLRVLEETLSRDSNSDKD